MLTPRFSLSPRHAASGLALLIALVHGTTASAQGHTADPYRPFNSMYDPFVFPTYPTADGYFPNQDRLEGRSGPSRANQFQNLLDENQIGADPSGLSRSAGAGSPYYRAHRRFDPLNRPNNSDADRRFREKQQERDARYFEARRKYQEAVSERDPQKRARLIQEYVAAKRLAEQEFRKGQDPSAPGPRTATVPPGTAAAPTPRQPRNAGPLSSSSSAAPAFARDAALPGAARPRSSPTTPRRSSVGSPPNARTPSQVLQESESLDGTDRSSTPPPPRPRLRSTPDPR